MVTPPRGENKGMLFQGKRALITGAASGIGRATAIRFAAEGAQVTIGDRNEDGLHETAAMMASVPVIQPFDAMDNASCQHLTAFPEGIDYALLMRSAPKLLDGACEPSDVAELFAYLASDRASKITGSIVSIDGGQVAG
eukprot:gene8093-8174_t